MFPLGQDFDATSWASLEPVTNELISREINSADELEVFFSDISDMAEHVSEAGAKLYIGMTCDTESEEKQADFLEFVENIRPKMSEISNQLDLKIVNLDYLEQLPERYDLIIRSMKNSIELFREENIPLSVQCTKLSTEYQKIVGAMTVEFQGEEYTLPQMRRFLESNDREVRREAWILVRERRMQDSQRITEILDELIELRHKIALNAGFENYRDYAFRSMERFDYTPADCYEFHKSVETHCMPVIHTINDNRLIGFGYNKLRPWDVNEKSGDSPDVQGRGALVPFEDVSELVSLTSEVFHRLSSELGGMFDRLVDGEVLDLDSRKGKAPGGYQYNLEKTGLPFIFMNASGQQGDVETMIHEAGHAFHSMYCSDLGLIQERNYPIEFAEVASMSMELLTQPHWGVFYEDAEECRRAKRMHLESVIGLLAWICRVDAFQHWMYENPSHTHRERSEYWLKLRSRFGPRTDWNGFEEDESLFWQTQGHLFGAPFYYIEYGIAQLGALQIWAKQSIDPQGALSDYKAAMMLGNTRSLPDLFQAADIKLGFDEHHIGSLVDKINSALVSL
ncbi:MAG: M3 family oligoendopeptidase [Euryarchaeota archaeon]|nr:M3 family oligoendopeptidase [Euryarchaeota archaeon]NDG21980.1 M3 family oligoendopeptidase [Euryarchaeota archaeon]